MPVFPILSVVVGAVYEIVGRTFDGIPGYSTLLVVSCRFYLRSFQLAGGRDVGWIFGVDHLIVRYFQNAFTV